MKTANTVRLEQKTAARLSWRMLAAEAILMADRAIASDGDELRIGIDFRHELAKQNQPKQAFPVGRMAASPTGAGSQRRSRPRPTRPMAARASIRATSSGRRRFPPSRSAA
ncbi:hypothetical protein [Caulobacter sp. CCUG 60055]|uniref:hypothetical protein n=1 Tax=Caulobacter sp. CCUG 60055 TaxID=2100090 RepID=UPI001FA811DB|nr:hypothetical protein [Caulobacter sp. CCUG 60055]